MSAFEKLVAYMKDAENIRKTIELLDWEQQAVMPVGAGAERAAMLGTLHALYHEKTTADFLDDLIGEAEIEDLDGWDKRALQLIRHNHTLKKSVPDELARQVSQAASEVQNIWSVAKPAKDWQMVLPALEKSFALILEQAKLWGAALDVDPYDAQLSFMSPGNSRAVIDPLFAQLKEALPPLARQIAEKNKNVVLETPVIAESARQVLIDKVATLFGYDFDRGRIDTAMHPFTVGTPNDARFTVSATETVLQTVYCVLHEVGHARYLQNLPQTYDGLAVGRENGMGIHESQALFVEMQIGCSDAFIPFLHKLIVDIDPGFKTSADDLRAYMQRIQPGLIRIAADEVHYPLHVLLRYEIEKDLFDGVIQVRDIPAVWNAKVKEYLGLDVPDDAQGCMQDIHWYSYHGFGYFPCYTQGALFAAQLTAAIRKEMPDFDARVGAGDFTAIMQWMIKKVHIWGQYYSPSELMERATGAKPDASDFIEHLKNRYLASQ